MWPRCRAGACAACGRSTAIRSRSSTPTSTPRPWSGRGPISSCGRRTWSTSRAPSPGPRRSGRCPTWPRSCRRRWSWGSWRTSATTASATPRWRSDPTERWSTATTRSTGCRSASTSRPDPSSPAWPTCRPCPATPSPARDRGWSTPPRGSSAVLISYEVFFADRGRAGVRAGGRLLLVPTNASSYVDAQVPAQQLAVARLRALETGRWVVQAAPTGYSAVIDHHGRVVARSGLGGAAVLRREVQLRTGRTVFVSLGSAPVLVAAAAILLAAHFRRKDPASVNPASGSHPFPEAEPVVPAHGATGSSPAAGQAELGLRRARWPGRARPPRGPAPGPGPSR